MPIRIPKGLPARELLEKDGIFVMDEMRSDSQDIRPLEIGILNLMPTKTATETQLLRLLGNTPLQVNIELVGLDTHESKNTSKEHLLKFYTPFSKIKYKKFDGFIITGAPVELLEFKEVDYWEELCEIMEWTKTNVFSTVHICWGAQAGLYHHYAINKQRLDEKCFGIFAHELVEESEKLVRDFDDVFYSPHSRHTTVSEKDILNCSDLKLLATSKQAGANIVVSNDRRQIFIFGHLEYDTETLNIEYSRDIGKGHDIEVPYNYFHEDDPNQKPKNKWRAHANLLFSNWLNYYVYQEVPY